MHSAHLSKSSFSLLSLKWSSVYGVEGLAFAAQREMKRLPPFKDYGKNSVSAEFAEVDRQDQHILMRSQLSEVGIPALATGDGNCLFNSMSIALTADEVLEPELRLRTAIEMSHNQDQYKNREDFNDLMSCSPSYEESLTVACTDRAYMSIWNVTALSSVVGNPVHSVYPPMSGEKDKRPPILNKVFSTDENKHKNSIFIMWSRLSSC